MSARDDIIEVPIEIKTSDLDELHRLIEELQEAKGVADNAKATKRKTPSSGSGAPIQGDDEERETLGIYNARDMDKEVMPMKGRDKKSKQAVETGNSFKDLKKEVENMQENQNNMLPFLSSIGNQLGFTLPYLATGGINLGKSFQSARVKSAAINRAPMATPAKGNVMGKFGRFASFGKALPYIGVAFMLYEWLTSELPAMINEQYFGVGKPMDRRFKRVIDNEFAAATTREEKAQISQGYRSVITTAYAGARGASNVANSKVRALNKENIYNKSEEYMI
jgi:hypothetical protein